MNNPDKKTEDQLLEGVYFHLELLELAREQQASYKEDVREYGYALEMLLVKYGVMNDCKKRSE